MKKHNDQKIQDVLKEMVGEKKFQHQYYRFLVQKFWKEEMAKLVVDSTDSVTLRDRTLYLKIISAPLRQELLYNRKTLLKKINKYLKQDFITEIRIS